MAVVDLGGQAEHEGQGLDVAVGDAAGVGAQDAAGERGVLVVLDHPSGAVWCQRVLAQCPGQRGGRACGLVWCPFRACTALMQAACLPRSRAA